MPLIAHNNLPSFARLKAEGEPVLTPEHARHQDIRELHIGLLNMMPDAALSVTEHQFFRLVGGSNEIAQFYLHPFTLDALPRGPEAKKHIETYYESFEDIKKQGLDALIITGANVAQPNITTEAFWEPLIEIFDWAYNNVASTLCSCLATHAALQFRYNQQRQPLKEKRWGVFQHRVLDKKHPLVKGVNTRFDVPHSRYNEIFANQFEAAGLQILVSSNEAGVHLAVSEDKFRLVFFQGHPEYDTISLLKEYKREVIRFTNRSRSDYPPFPQHYFGMQQQAILQEYQQKILLALKNNTPIPEFPEKLVATELDNTWRDTAEAIIDNWIGAVYRLTNNDRTQHFMEGVDPDDPLGLRS